MPRTPARPLLFATLCAATLLSLAILKLAPFLLVGSFIALVALPRDRTRTELWLVAVSLGFALLGFVRFLIVEAVPGIVEGGTRAAEGVAVSRLREILFAEDSLRRLATIDPDGDGVGSSARLDELTGRVGLRDRLPLASPLLERYPKSQPTARGPAIELGGFLFFVCLPTPDGGLSAMAGAPVDEERAERRFVAYAWPADARQQLNNAYFMDEHERILVAPSGPGLRLGTEHPPSCDDWDDAATKKAWRPWRNKRPRDTLPGDRRP